MKRLRKPTVCDNILELFEEVGAEWSVEQVCQKTGAKNYNSLKALFSYIRKAPHIPDENRIDVKIDLGVCKRVE